MKRIRAIIIHPSTLISNGLKSILHSKNITDVNIHLSFPDVREIKEWNDSIVIIDVNYTSALNNYFSILKKNSNHILGICHVEYERPESPMFESIINIFDDSETIVRLVEGCLPIDSKESYSSELSRREIEILKLVAGGKSNKQIADELFISSHTVITHRKNITAKLGIKSISGLTLYALVNNLIEL